MQSNLGWIIVVASEGGIVAVRIGRSVDELLAEVREELPGVTLVEDAEGLEAESVAIGRLAQGLAPEIELALDVSGTEFQARVWRALAQIPAGEVRTYAQVADLIGSPKAARAVGGACGANPVALVIPCHRVVRADGGLGDFRWGVDVKRSLLDREA